MLNFNYDNHNDTEQVINTSYSYSFLPLLDLLLLRNINFDNVMTNVFNDAMVYGIFDSDVSDHLPVLSMLNDNIVITNSTSSEKVTGIFVKKITLFREKLLNSQCGSPRCVPRCVIGAYDASTNEGLVRASTNESSVRASVRASTSEGSVRASVCT